jgi:hypothetical protein
LLRSPVLSVRPRALSTGWPRAVGVHEQTIMLRHVLAIILVADGLVAALRPASAQR